MPDDKGRQRLSVGPLEEDWDELAELAKDLNSWVVEGLNIAALRKPLERSSYDKLWRQLKLIEALMSKLLACGLAETMAVVGPLKDLNAVRVGHAHNLDSFETRHLEITGRRVREAWFVLVDSIVDGLHLLSKSVQTPPDTCLRSS